VASEDLFKRLPKVELHRHLEGSLRLSTMLEVAHQHGLDVPASDPPRLRELVQILDEEPFTFENFLSKFKTLRLFYQSKDVITRFTREAIADAAADNVFYLELRFTPVALSNVQGFHLAEVMDWVIEATEQASREFNLPTRLIASVNRHEPVELAARVVQFAIERRERGIVGIDLAGNEAEFSATPFREVFREAREAGLHITIHAGEWSGAGNVREAIRDLDAERIGHGVRVLEDPNVVALARERGTLFEVCITSNYQSGVVPALSNHPLAHMLNAGLNATINTDDPSVSHITLSDEYRIAHQDLGLPLDVLRERTLAALDGAFLLEEEKSPIRQRLLQQWDAVIRAAA